MQSLFCDHRFVHSYNPHHMNVCVQNITKILIELIEHERKWIKKFNYQLSLYPLYLGSSFSHFLWYHWVRPDKQQYTIHETKSVYECKRSQQHVGKICHS